jgi:hypothetical protein
MEPGKQRNDLILVVGAGASIPCGLPSTADLTKTAFEAVPSEDLRRMLREALRGVYGKVNFELLLYALEALAQFVESTGTESVAYRPVISAFADLLVRYQPLSNQHQVQTMLLDMVRSIHQRVGDDSNIYLGHRCTPAVQAQQQFIAQCAARFRLIVIDLNYDTLFDQMPIDWYDGFEPVEPPPPQYTFGVFDPNKWIAAYESDRHLLIHLHGSAQFSFANAEVMAHLGSFLEQVRYDDVAGAQAAFRTVYSSGGDPPYVANLPIISGFGKVAKLANTMRPYGHYHLTAMRALFTTPRLLVIGYGGLDDHLNIWIEEHVAMHGSNRRAVAILTRTGAEVGPFDHKYHRLRTLAGADGWSALNDFAFDNGDSERAVWFGGQLAFAPCGAPEAYAYAEPLLDFLEDAGRPLASPITNCADAVAAALPRHTVNE